jgi:FMN reductase
MTFTVLVGNPKPQSTTLRIARLAAEAVSGRAGLATDPAIVDLSVLARRLLLDEPAPAVDDALEQVSGTELLLVASPTYKATYSGLLKVFLDRLGHRALDGVIALPMLVMRVPQHALAVDVHLRPLLTELGAAMPAPGLAFLESDAAQPDLVLGPWSQQVTAALRQAAALIPARPAADAGQLLSTISLEATA